MLLKYIELVLTRRFNNYIDIDIFQYDITITICPIFYIRNVYSVRFKRLLKTNFETLKVKKIHVSGYARCNIPSLPAKISAFYITVLHTCKSIIIFSQGTFPDK